MSLSMLGKKFKFLIVTSKVKKIESTSSGASVWVSVWVCGGPGVQVCGCVGDCFFFLSYSFNFLPINDAVF